MGFLLSALGFTGTPAMSAHPTPIVHCHVVGEQMLPPSSGGGGTVCSEIEHAVAAVAPNVSYEAEIRVLSASRLAATLVVNGRPLPEQRFAIMDRDLNTAAIRRFAQSLAQEVAKAAKP